MTEMVIEGNVSNTGTFESIRAKIDAAIESGKVGRELTLVMKGTHLISSAMVGYLHYLKNIKGVIITLRTDQEAFFENLGFLGLDQWFKIKKA